MKNPLLCGLAALVAALLPAAPARAGVTFYSTAADYAAATTGNTAYTFSGPPAGGGTSEGSTYILGPLTFTGRHLYLVNANQYGSGITYLEEDQSPETIGLSGATALGFTLGTYNTAESIAVAVNGAAAGTVTTTGGRPTTLFLGITDTVPITSLTFTNTTFPGDEIDVINFQVGSAAVPEPSTWALLGMGVVGAGIVALRRRRCAV